MYQALFARLQGRTTHVMCEPLSASALPKRTVRDKDVEDRPETPNQAHDEPDELFESVDVCPPQKINPHQNHRNRMQDDG